MPVADDVLQGMSTSRLGKGQAPDNSIAVADYSDRHRCYGKAPSRAAFMEGWTASDHFAATDDMRTVQTLYRNVNAQGGRLANWYDGNYDMDKAAVKKLCASDPKSESAPTQQLSMTD